MGRELNSAGGPLDNCVNVKVALVGAFGGTHVGASIWRAAKHLGIEGIRLDASNATGGNRLLHALLWHFAGRRPPHLRRFSAEVLAACAQLRPDILIATGAAPLTKPTLRKLRARGIVSINYSTDDPWNPVMRASWYLKALPEYDFVFSTRRVNIEDFERLGCAEVHFLPFGYDEWLFRLPERRPAGVAHDVLFVGGADRDRVAFMTEFMRSGPPVALVGGYWERFPAMRPYALGQRPPEALSALTAAAKVNLCLVRRANRDGHVMRSFEIAAIGGCMLAEDTTEHREIFGADGECALYFRTPEEAARRAQMLLVDAAERARLASAVRKLVVGGAHTYRARLLTMLHTVAGDTPRKTLRMKTS
jgi:spore maturation protein CgeB